MQNHLIRHHLRNMIILGIPMRTLRSGTFYLGCRLRLGEDGESFSLLGASGDQRPGRIALTYTIDGYLHGFETDAVGIGDGTDHMLSIDPPRKIVRIEKRRFCRVTPPENEPVEVAARLGEEEITAQVIAMSEEHLGLVFPAVHPGLAVDTVLAMRFILPGFGQVAAKGAVRFLRDSWGVQGLVVGLEEIEEPDRAVLAKYVRAREVELHARNATPRREASFLLTTFSANGSHAFWCPAPLMGSIRATGVAFDVASVEATDYLSEA